MQEVGAVGPDQLGSHAAPLPAECNHTGPLNLSFHVCSMGTAVKVSEAVPVTRS